VGMHPGDEKRITLQPEDAFGAIYAKKFGNLTYIKRFNVTTKYPLFINAPNATQGKVFTYLNNPFTYVVTDSIALIENVSLNQTIGVPDTLWKGRVVNVTAEYVFVYALAPDGAIVETTLGNISIQRNETTITTIILKNIGEPMILNKAVGHVYGFDGDTMIVNLNHPFAGQPIVADIKLVSIN
ncbi:MAG: hypothetical protein ABIA93_04460, partial [Candidatus Woesearchaeota archaeon]